LHLVNGEGFFLRVSKIGNQNITTQIFTYDASKPLINVGTFILHGSLRVTVLKAFSPSGGVPSPSGRVADNSTLVASSLGVSDGTMEFEIDWNLHPKLNVTISKPGWLTNSTLQNVVLKPWNTSTTTVSLETTVRVNVISELYLPIPKATVAVSSFGTTPKTFVDGTQSDQDGRADGIVYVALDPASINPIASISVSRSGFSTWASGPWTLDSSHQLNITSIYPTTKSGLQYNLRVKAIDELGNIVTLNGSDTTFAGLTVDQLDFSQGTAYMAADPTPGNLTIAQKGYVNTSTAGTVSPSSSSAFNSQTITYQPIGGAGPGLPFTVKVVAVYDELGNQLQIGPSVGISSTTGTFILSSGEAYIPASGKLNITVISPGYVGQTLRVTPASSFQTTILFGNTTSGATTIRPGLQFTLKVVGIYDELGDSFQLGTNATITSSTSQVILASGRAYIPAPSKTSLTVVALGYATATAIITPSSTNQTRILFRDRGMSADIVEPSLLFNFKVQVSQAWDGSAISGATVDVFSYPTIRNLSVSSMSDNLGTSYLPLGLGTFYLRVSMTNYPTVIRSVQASSSNQTVSMIRFVSKTTTISVGTASIVLTASTNLSHVRYSSTFGLTFTYNSPSVGTVNSSIPMLLIPSGFAVEVLSGGQTISVQFSQDAQNMYLHIPTPPGNGIVQLAFRYSAAPLPASSSPLQSPVVVGALAFGLVLAGGIPYVLGHRRRGSSSQMSLQITQNRESSVRPIR